MSPVGFTPEKECYTVLVLQIFGGGGGDLEYVPKRMYLPAALKCMLPEWLAKIFIEILDLVQR
jgi:hypothetical protein